MKQLSIFEKELKKLKTCSTGVRTYWKLFTDGASRNNPGPSGAGIFLLKNDYAAEKYGAYLGSKTNNQAEYLALILGIFFLKKYACKGDLALLVSDSQLLVRQIKGEYKVKNPELKKLHALAHELLKDVTYNIVHVLREENKEADALANHGVDKKKKPPVAFLDLLRRYKIPL